jgi:hypothetical protein
MKIKRIILIPILLYILNPNYSQNMTLNESFDTLRLKLDDPNKTQKEPLMSKASSDSLYKVLFGSLPSSNAPEAKTKKESYKNKSFSIKTTDKVKTKSAFY